MTVPDRTAVLSEVARKTCPRPFLEAAGEGHTLTVRPVVLCDASPEAGPSEVFGLFGVDGAGKTTLINDP